MAIVAGLDGGGTKTLCALSDEGGRILAVRASGPSNYLTVGRSRASRYLASALLGACRRARVQRLGCLCAGLAGCGRAQGVAVGRQMIKQALSTPGAPACRRIMVTSDAATALQGSFLGSPGIVLISGTGSVAMGCDGRGRCERAGGWGRILGDEGSCYDVGRKALLDVMKSWDGRRGPSLLQHKVAAFLGTSGPDEIVRAASMKAFAGKIPGLAPLVFDAARQGDAGAQRILREASMDMAEMVGAVATRLNLNEFNLACVGGTFHDGDLILPVLEGRLRELGFGCRIAKPHLPPVGGALLMASTMLRTRPAEGFAARLEEGLSEVGLP